MATYSGLPTDTTAVSAAILAAASAGEVLYFPPQTYTLGPLAFSGVPGIHLKADEGLAKFVLTNGSNDDSLRTTSCDHLRIDGLTFDGNKANQGANAWYGNGVQMLYGNDVKVRNCAVVNAFNCGIRAAGLIDFDLENNDISLSGVIGAYVAGYYRGPGLIDYAIRNNVRRNRIHQNGNDGLDFDLAVRDSEIVNNQVWDNDFDGDGDGGGIVATSDASPLIGIIISGNTVDRGDIFVGGIQGFSVTGNTVRNSGPHTTLAQGDWGHGIAVHTTPVRPISSDGVISGNVVIDSAKHGIRIFDQSDTPTTSRWARNIAVSSNVVKNSGVLAPNTFDNFAVNSAAGVSMTGNVSVCDAGRTRRSLTVGAQSSGFREAANTFAAGLSGVKSNPTTDTAGLEFDAANRVLSIDSYPTTAAASGAGSVKMGDTHAASNSDWVPFIWNGQIKWVPAWTTPIP